MFIQSKIASICITCKLNYHPLVTRYKILKIELQNLGTWTFNVFVKLL